MEDLLCSRQFMGDAFLFGFEQVEWDGVRVACLHEFELLVLELSFALLLALQLNPVSALSPCVHRDPRPSITPD